MERRPHAGDLRRRALRHGAPGEVRPRLGAAAAQPQHAVRITIPLGTSYEVVAKDRLPRWDAFPPGPSVAFGAAWVREGRSAVLLVPSVVAREERNVVINPAHPDAGGIEHSLHEPVHWDRRLFEGR